MTETKEYDIKKLKELIDAKDIIGIKTFMSENDLILVDNIIESKHKKFFNDEMNLYDLKQYVTKIESNSAYGSILNTSSTFFDFRLGASITMTGRVVWKHLASKTNELLAGIYDHTGDAIVTGDTDSEISTSKHKIIENGIEKEVTVEDLFLSCGNYHFDEKSDKEYGFTKTLVLGYNDNDDKPEYLPINYVYRHKTSKEKWEIEDENGNIVTVTSDHSCMVERDGKLISVKPSEILENDILVTINDN